MFGEFMKFAFGAAVELSRPTGFFWLVCEGIARVISDLERF